MNDLADIDIFTPANYTDGFPHDLFTRLRAEDPVHWTTEALTPEFPFVRTRRGFWAVTRHSRRRPRRAHRRCSPPTSEARSHRPRPGPLALQTTQVLTWTRRTLGCGAHQRASPRTRSKGPRGGGSQTQRSRRRRQGEVDFVTSRRRELPR